MLRIFCLTLGVLMCLFLNDVSGFAQDGKRSTSISPPEAEQWREDLRFMATEAPKWHNNLFHTITPAQFDGAVKRLHERIPNLARQRNGRQVLRASLARNARDSARAQNR